jgi:hypothetical protein
VVAVGVEARLPSVLHRVLPARLEDRLAGAAALGV